VDIRIRIPNKFWLRQPKFKGSGDALGVALSAPTLSVLKRRGGEGTEGRTGKGGEDPPLCALSSNPIRTEAHIRITTQFSSGDYEMIGTGSRLLTATSLETTRRILRRPISISISISVMSISASVSVSVAVSVHRASVFPWSSASTSVAGFSGSTAGFPRSTARFAGSTVRFLSVAGVVAAAKLATRVRILVEVLVFQPARHATLHVTAKLHCWRRICQLT